MPWHKDSSCRSYIPPIRFRSQKELAIFRKKNMRKPKPIWIYSGDLRAEMIRLEIEEKERKMKQGRAKLLKRKRKISKKSERGDKNEQIANSSA